MPLKTEVGGRMWYCYAVEFETADGMFSTYIYALSDDHAEMIVQELKQTAKLSGRIEGVIKA